jgi:hypothetical protein
MEKVLATIVAAKDLKKDDVIILPNGKKRVLQGIIVDPADEDLMAFFGESEFMYLQMEDQIKIDTKVNEEQVSN